MAAGLEEVSYTLETVHPDRPANVGKATTLEHARQYIARVSLELDRPGIHIPKKPALLDRYRHHRQRSMTSRARNNREAVRRPLPRLSVDSISLTRSSTKAASPAAPKRDRAR